MVNDEQIVDLLQNVPLFKNLKRRQLQRLARIFIDRTIDEGDVIVPQGRDGYGFFVLVSGAAEAGRERAEGSDVVVSTVGPDDYLGDTAILANGPRTASVIATEPTTCLILRREKFLGVLRRDGDMAVEILIELARRFRVALEVF